MGKVDFLIVGQGIAGSILSYELLRSGNSVMVVDEETDRTSSNRAAGLYNPITGRKMVKTWLADQLFPGLEDYYRELELFYGGRFLFPKTIYRPFYSTEELNDWQAKAGIKTYQYYIKEIISRSLEIHGVNDPYGGLKLNYCGYVDLPVLVSKVRDHLKGKGLFISERLAYADLTIKNGRVRYKDLDAAFVVFCDGTVATGNPYWNHLPFRPVKGEILDIEAELPEELIINRGVFMLPKNRVIRVGSTYDHDNLSFNPTEKGMKNLQFRLSKTYSGSYKVVGHTAGIRPATFDRRPFIGLHPDYDQVGIFNGFGTKGVSLVPYFARQFVNYLMHNTRPDAEVSTDRVKN